jgi:hypothetical protein
MLTVFIDVEKLIILNKLNTFFAVVSYYIQLVMRDLQKELELLFAELQLYSFYEEEFLIAMEEIHKRLRNIIIQLKNGSSAMILAELEVTKLSVRDADDLKHKTNGFIAYAVHLDQTIIQTLQTVAAMEPQN